MSRSARLNRMFTRPESTQTRSICDHRQANRKKGVDTPVSQLPRQRASVGSTERSREVTSPADALCTLVTLDS